MSWTDLSVKLKREVVERLDFMSRRSMSQTTRLNREIVNATRISVPRVKIMVDDSDYVITVYTGIEKILKIEIKKGYDQKTVVSRSENNCETVQSKPSDKSTMDVFVEILASFFNTKTVDIGVVEWDFKQHAVLGSENDMKMKKRQGIFVNVLLSKIEKSTGGTIVFHVEKLVISDKCASDFTRGLLNLCDKEYLDSMEVLTLTSIEKASKNGAWCDVYTENAESFYSQGVFYEEVPCVDKFLMTTSYRTTNWSTLRFARLNEKAMKIWSRAGSVYSRTPDKKEFKITREKAEKKILLHKKTECGYSITVYTDEKFEKLGGMKWFETEFMNQKCDLGWFCKKCCDPFDFWYHQNLPTLNSKVLEINSDDNFVKSWGFKKDSGPPTGISTAEIERRPSERDQLIAQYEQLSSEVSHLAENFTKKMLEEIKKLRDLPQTKEIKTGLAKCRELKKGTNDMVETVMSMLLKFKNSEEFGVDVIRVRIGQVLEAKSRLEASMKLFGGDGPKNKLPLQQIEKEILIAQCELLFPEVSDLSVVVLAKISEVSKELEGVPPSYDMKAAMKPLKESMKTFRDIPELNTSMLNLFKNNSNQVSVKVIRERLESTQKLRIRLEGAMKSAEAMNAQNERSQLIAECERLFAEAAKAATNFTTKLSKEIPTMERLTHLNGVKEKLDFFKFLETLGTELPGKMRMWIFQMKYTNMFGMEEIREKLSWVQRVKRDFVNGMQLFEPRDPLQDSKTERDALIAQSEQLFSEITQIATAISQKMSKGLQLIELFWTALDNETKTVLKDKAVAMREKYDSLPPVLESLLKEFKSSAKHSLGKMRVLYQMALEMKVEAEGHLKQLGNEDPTIDVKLVPEVSGSDDVAKEIAEALKEAIAHKILNTLATSETLISSEDKKESQKKIPDTLGASEDVPSLDDATKAPNGKKVSEPDVFKKIGKKIVARAEKSDVAHEILDTPVASENPDDVTKTPTNGKKDPEDALDVSDALKSAVTVTAETQQSVKFEDVIKTPDDKKDSEAMNPATEKAELVAQCEQLFPEVARTLIKHTEIMTQYLKELNEVPQTDEVKKEVNDCKEVLKLLDCLPANLLKTLEKIKGNDEVEVEKIRQLMVQAQNIRRRMDAQVKRLEGMGSDVGEQANENETTNPQNQKAELIAECEELFPRVLKLAADILSKLSEHLNSFDDGSQLDDTTRIEVEKHKEKAKLLTELPQNFEAWLNEFKYCDGVKVEFIQETIQTVVKMEENLKAYMIRWEEVVNESKARKSSVTIKILIPPGTSETLVNRDEGIKTPNGKQESESDVYKKVGKKIVASAQKSDDAVASEDPDDVTKTPNGKKDPEGALDVSDVSKSAVTVTAETQQSVKFEDVTKTPDDKSDSEAMNPAAEKAELVVQCEQLFPEAARSLLKLTGILTACLRGLNEAPQTDDVKTVTKDCTDVLKSIDGVPRSLLHILRRIRTDDTVKIEEIREMMVMAQDARQKTEVEVKRLEGLGISEDVGKENTDPDVKSLLIAQCKQLFAEVDLVASNLLKKVTKRIKQIEDLPQKTEELNNGLQACQNISSYCERLPDAMKNELTDLVEYPDFIGVEEIRDTIGKIENIKHMLENQLKQCDDLEDSEDVKKKTSVILNYEKHLLISQCEQLFPEVAQMASKLVVKLSNLLKYTEGLQPRTEAQKNGLETCLEVLNECKPVPESTMNYLTYLLENSNKIGVEEIRYALETAQGHKEQLEEWLSGFENHKLSDRFDTAEVVDTVSLQKERQELSAEFVQLTEDVIQIAMNFSTKLAETAEFCRTRVAKPAEFKDFRESCEKVAEHYKNHSKKLADALKECKENDLVKMDVGEIRRQILKLQEYKVELENDVETIAVKFWKKDSQNANDAPDVKTMAITDGVCEDVIKTPDDKKDYEAINPAAGKDELIAQCEKLIPEVVQSVIEFLGILTKYIKKLEDGAQTDDVKADLKGCKHALKPIDNLPAKLLNELRRIKGDDTLDVEKIRETMVKAYAIRREMETAMKRFEGMDFDVGEQANGKETKNPACEDAPEESGVFQKIGKKMFGSIPEANALVDPRSRKARSVNPDDYDYVGSMYPDDFTHYLEHRRKVENRDFDFECSWARLQFLAVFFFVLFSILFVIFWIESFVY